MFVAHFDKMTKLSSKMFAIVFFITVTQPPYLSGL